MEQTKYMQTLETIRRLLRRNARQNLRNLMSRIHPVDQASLLGDLSPPESVEVFKELIDDEMRAAVIASMAEGQAAEFLSNLDETTLERLFKSIQPDDLAAILEHLPDDQTEKFREMLSAKDIDHVDDLLAYPDETAGRIMTQKVFALHLELKVHEAIDRVRSAERAEMVFYLYIIDEHHRLMGVVSLRKLLLTPGETQLRSIMIPEVISVTPELDQEEVARLVARYDLLAIPVIDDTGKLLGIITVDDIIDIIHDEAKEDIYRLAGSSLNEEDASSSLHMARVRFPWLLIRYLGGFISVLLLITMSFYSGNQFVFLAAMVPLLISMVGGIGVQSSTIVAERLALRSDKRPQARAIISRELSCGIVLGAVYSLIPCVILYHFSNLQTAVAVSLSLFIGMIAAALAGAVLPILYHKLNRDPVSVTGSIIASLLDIIGVGVYLLVFFSIQTLTS